MTMQWLFSRTAYFLPFSNGLLLLIWILILGGAIYQTRAQHPRWRAPHAAAFVVLLALTPLLAAFGGFFRPSSTIAPLSEAVPVLVPFASLTWMLAAGFLGTGPAVILALISGSVVGIWGSHLTFEPFVQAVLALLFGWATWQPYQERFYRLIRQPIIATVFLTAIYPFLFIFGVLTLGSSPLAARVDYAFSHIGIFTLYKFIELLIAGVVAQIAHDKQKYLWGYHGPARFSSWSRSLHYKFLVVMVGIMGAVVIGILLGNWVMAQRSAREMLTERLSSTANIAAKSMPFFTENGDSLIRKLAHDEALWQEPSPQLNEYLHQLLTESFFFNEMLLVDAQGHTIASYPPNETLLAPERMYVLHFLASNEMQGVPIATHLTVTAPAPTDASETSSGVKKALVVFAASLPLPQGQNAPEQNQETPSEPRFLIGRAILSNNPYAEPIVKGLAALSNIGGGALIVDNEHQILYATAPDIQWMETAISNDKLGPADIHSALGERYLAYTTQAVGSSWLIIVAAPARNLQEIALNNAWPLTLWVLMLSLVGVSITGLLLRRLTRSLRELTQAAESLASGQLDHTLEINSMDEVGQLGQAFEHMRQRLRKRMDELNRLLQTSQRVAASLRVEDAAQAVLGASLASGATVVRVALSPEALPDDWNDDYPLHFGKGLDADRYQSLDPQILPLVRSRSPLRLTNIEHSTTLQMPPGIAPPKAILAVALQYEQRFLGVLYLIYNTPHTFTDEEVRYISTLAMQMAMAAYTARLYFMAEVRHQRLTAVINASPDPILVTDNQERLILANAAAFEQLPIRRQLNLPLEEAIQTEDLIQLLRRKDPPPYSTEITLNGRVYFATVASVHTSHHEVGRVCILRDVTHFKELDALKSEFVATVSHDLRAPLTLMRGYITMLEMVGELNERQKRYTQQIQQGVEDMTQLVNNLLDLGRIEAGVGLQLQLVSVLDIIENIIKRWQPRAQQKHITLHTNIAPDAPPLVEADPVLLDRALHNLVDNAIKYTPEGGTVTIFAKPAGDTGIILGVSDTGVGISPLDKPRLFEKFFRVVRRDQPKEKGTGLGLSIVKSIVERHHGRIWVESQLRQGSTFFIQLPLRQPKPDD